MHGHLDDAFVIVNPMHRARALQVLKQGVYPVASHLCANDWCGGMGWFVFVVIHGPACRSDELECMSK